MSIALMTEVWRLDIATTDKMVLLALADAANDDGVTWIAVASRKQTDRLDLLKKTSLSERAVQGALKRLVGAGLLSRDDRPGRGTIWTVNPRAKCAPAASAPRSICAPADNDINPRSRCGETVSNHQPTSEAKASSVVRMPAGFADFWKAYPRKKSKGDAERAFAKACRNIGPDALAVILAGIERALPGWDDPTFIPYPASWLNDRGWEDEPPPVSSVPGAPSLTPPKRSPEMEALHARLMR